MWTLKLSRTHRLLILLCLLFVFFVLELIISLITHSLSLLADAFHMFSDLLAILIALTSIRLAKRSPGKRFSYGFQRAEVLGALVNAVFLVALCVSIVVDALQRFAKPETVENPKLVFLIGSLGLGINLLALLLFAHPHGHHHGHHHHGHHENHEVNTTEQHEGDHEGCSNHHHHHHHRDEHDYDVEHAGGMREPCSLNDADDSSDGLDHGHRGAKTASLNMRAVLLHVLGDALGSIVVMVSSAAIWFGSGRFVENYVDPLASLLISIIIVYFSVPLIKQTSTMLLNAAPGKLDVHELKKSIAELPHVEDVHELHVWELSDIKSIGSVHVKISTDGEFMDVGASIRDKFHAVGVHSITVQPEHQREGGSHGCLLKCEQLECEAYVCCPSDE